MPQIVETRVYVGRNLLCDYPAIAARLRFDELPRADLATVEAKVLDLAAAERIAMPPLAVAGPANEESLSRAVGWLAAALQNAANAGVARFGTAYDSDGRLWALAGYQAEKVARAAIAVACRVIDIVARCDAAALAGLTLPPSVRHAIGNIVKLGRGSHLDLHSLAIAEAALLRDIPVYPIRPGAPFAQLGQGIRQQLISATAAGTGRQIAAMICSDKELTGYFLARAGLPTTAPETAMTLADAERIAARIGYPVVVKPASASEGDGLTSDIRDAAELKTAMARATEAGHGRPLVERHFPGDEIRLLTVSGRLIQAVMRVPAHVVGDGRHTISELVAEVNRDPRRGPRQQTMLARIVEDEQSAVVLARQGYSSGDVPEVGRRILLRLTSNISTGGTAVDVTGTLHPAVREMAEATSRALDLDIAGIDYITPDATRTWRDGGGYVCEVNHRPGLRPHMLTPGDRGTYLNPIIDRIFAPGETGRIPIALIAGGDAAGRARVAGEVETRLAARGVTVGVADDAGIRVGGCAHDTGDARGAPQVDQLMRHPFVEMAVASLSPDELAGRGVPLDRCTVVAILPGGARPDTDALAAAAATGAVVTGTGGGFGGAAVRSVTVEAGAGFEGRFAGAVVNALIPELPGASAISAGPDAVTGGAAPADRAKG